MGGGGGWLAGQCGAAVCACAIPSIVDMHHSLNKLNNIRILPNVILEKQDQNRVLCKSSKSRVLVFS